jgi:hypothetical protein
MYKFRQDKKIRPTMYRQILHISGIIHLTLTTSCSREISQMIFHELSILHYKQRETILL